MKREWRGGGATTYYSSNKVSEMGGLAKNCNGKMGSMFNPRLRLLHQGISPNTTKTWLVRDGAQ